MAGLIGTGQAYRTQAISGLTRRSREQSEIDAANKELEAGEKSQQVSMSATGAGLGYLAGSSGGAAAGTAAGASSGTAAGASAGSWGGPIGAVIGAGLGYLLSRLF